MNMTYCMWHNTNLSLKQLLNDLEDALDSGNSLEDYLADRDESEQQAVNAVKLKCQQILDILGTMEGEED